MLGSCLEEDIHLCLTMTSVSSKAKKQKRSARVQISEHNLFPLTISKVGAAHVAASKTDESFLWHERYGHINFNSL